MPAGQDPILRAVFGGTFDPVHRGHLAVAVAVREALDTPDFRFLPAGNPPHREATFAAPAHRLRMLELALANDSAFTIDDRELRRDGPSWMSVTLESLRAEHPADSLVLVLGQDAFNGFDRWHEWRRIPTLAHLVVMTRPGERPVAGGAVEDWLADRAVSTPAELRDTPAGRVLFLDVPPVPVSSTQIRRCVSDPAALRRLVPGIVADYIERHGLYTDAATAS